MFDILTPGQKLKKLRKELHLTQAQLASGSISREFISMVEHDVREMSNEIALLLLQRLKAEAFNQNIEFSYDEFYLARNLDEEILYKVKHLNKKLIPSELILIKESISKHKILEAELYLDYEIGKRYLETNDLVNALKYSRKAYDAALQQENNDILMKTSNNLGNIKSSLNHIQESIAYFNTAFALTNDRNIKSTILYNIITTLYHSANYEAVEEEFRRIDLLGFKVDEEYNNYLLNIKGLILLQKNKLEQAKEIFNKLLNVKNDPMLKAMVLSNLSEVESQSKNYKLAEQLNNESAAIRQNQPLLLQENMLNSAHILWDSGKPYLAAKILRIFIKKNNGPRVGNAFKLLLDIYRSQNDLEQYLPIFKNGLEFFSKSNQKEKLIEYIAMGSQYLGNIIPEEYYSVIKQYLNSFAD